MVPKIYTVSKCTQLLVNTKLRRPYIYNILYFFTKFSHFRFEKLQCEESSTFKDGLYLLRLSNLLITSLNLKFQSSLNFCAKNIRQHCSV